MNYQKRTTIKAGFSLIELLVAMGMVGIGLIGVASLAAQNIRVQYFNRNSLISSQLAQEGLELARNLRDNDWKSSSPTSSLDELYDYQFIIDYEGHYSPAGIEVSSTEPLRINDDGFYSYVGDTITPFRRLLTSECYPDEAVQSDYCLIKCYVSWQGQGQSGVYQAEDYIYAWY